MSKNQTTSFTALLVSILVSAAALGQSLPIAKTFHNCTTDGGTANVKGYQSASEIYACDEGRIELEGRWSMIVEHGWLYRLQLGRQDGTPYRPSESYLKMFKWCATPTPWDKTQIELCGLVPPAKCWDGKPPRFDGTGDWTCKAGGSR